MWLVVMLVPDRCRVFVVGRWCWVTFQFIWIIVERGPFVFAVVAGGGCLVISFLFPIIYLFLLAPSGRRRDID